MAVLICSLTIVTVIETPQSSGISKAVVVGIVLGAIACAVILSAIVSLVIFRILMRGRTISKRRQGEYLIRKKQVYLCFAL